MGEDSGAGKEPKKDEECETANGQGKDIDSGRPEDKEATEVHRQLVEAERRLRHIVEHSTNMFYSHDPEGVLTYVSPQSIDFLGLDAEEVDRPWTDFITDHPVNRKGEAYTRKAIETGEPQPAYELQLKTGDGRIIWVEVNETPVVEDGRTVEIVGSLTDITEKKKSTELIGASLKEKETLLAEIHHRVKNNLAVISSLMEFQSMSHPDPELRSQLQKARLRIHSMAAIHEQLYQSESYSQIHFSTSLRNLIERVVSALRTSTRISLEFDLEEIELNIKQCVPCSLLVNEVVSNILKHSFQGIESGVIRSRLHIEDRLINEDVMIRLEISDNGTGMPDHIEEKKQHSMGLRLIDLLTRQLDGEKEYLSEEQGTTFRLRFPIRGRKAGPVH